MAVTMDTTIAAIAAVRHIFRIRIAPEPALPAITHNAPPAITSDQKTDAVQTGSAVCTASKRLAC